MRRIPIVPPPPTSLPIPVTPNYELLRLLAGSLVKKASTSREIVPTTTTVAAAGNIETPVVKTSAVKEPKAKREVSLMSSIIIGKNFKKLCLI